MFTGIIQSVGEIARIVDEGESARVTIAAGGLPLDDVGLGDSIAVSGPCLTVVEISDGHFTVDVSKETLSRTTLGAARTRTRVNLEKALRLSDRLGGHLVTGHVDGIGEVVERSELRDYVRFRIAAPAALARYIAEKGSICVDGVSLTVNAVAGRAFDLMIIPHTLQETTLGALAVAGRVNLEIDLVARYIERLAAYGGDDGAGQGITAASLARSGFNEA